MEAITRVVTFTGTRLHGYKHFERREWIEMEEERNAGRFVLSSSQGRSRHPTAPEELSQTISDEATTTAAPTMNGWLAKSSLGPRCKKSTFSSANTALRRKSR